MDGEHASPVELVREPTLENFRTIFVEPVYRNVAMRSVGVAAAVTVIDALIALPMAFFMAKVASPRIRHWLVIAILTPLWASYLVKAYSWRVMLGQRWARSTGCSVGRAADPGTG